MQVADLAQLKLPLIVAPMFLVSGPDLVVETCRAGAIGSFPALNQRTSNGYAAWLKQIQERLDRIAQETSRILPPFAVNLVIHPSNSRLQDDLALTVEHKVPIVITSLGVNADVISRIQSYGGRVFHDVINVRHARKASEAGVDGLIAVCAGAGGHGGTISPFALTSEIRQFFKKTLVLSGSITSGNQIAAARLMGADLAYVGTRFISTQESMAAPAYKQMLIDSTASDIVYSNEISGIFANFLRPSILAAAHDPGKAKFFDAFDMSGSKAKMWKDVWSAGHGVGSIDDIPTTGALCERLLAEYLAASARGQGFLAQVT